MIEAFKMYKHKSCLDICIFVLDTWTFPDHGLCGAQVKYWNDKWQVFQDMDIIYIKNKDLDNWIEVE